MAGENQPMPLIMYSGGDPVRRCVWWLIRIQDTIRNFCSVSTFNQLISIVHSLHWLCWLRDRKDSRYLKTLPHLPGENRIGIAWIMTVKIEVCKSVHCTVLHMCSNLKCYEHIMFCVYLHAVLTSCFVFCYFLCVAAQW